MKTSNVLNSETHYPKTWRGETVLTISDFAYYAYVSYTTVLRCIKDSCIVGKDYYYIQNYRELCEYKNENPRSKPRMPRIILITTQGAEKLCKELRCHLSKIEGEKEISHPVEEKHMTIIPQPKKETTTNKKDITTDDCITALTVLNRIRFDLGQDLVNSVKNGGNDVDRITKSLTNLEGIVTTVYSMLAKTNDEFKVPF